MHDFNDGKDWIINFKWEPDIKTVGQWHADYHLIEITDGWTDWSYGLYTHPQHNILPGTQQLYLGNGQNFSPTTWSIVIDASASEATAEELDIDIKPDRVPVFNGWWLLMGIFPGLFLILRRVRRG